MASLEEVAMLLNRMGTDLVNKGQQDIADRFFERARFVAEQSSHLRKTIQAPEAFGIDELFDQLKEK